MSNCLGAQRSYTFPISLYILVCKLLIGIPLPRHHIPKASYKLCIYPYLEAASDFRPLTSIGYIADNSTQPVTPLQLRWNYQDPVVPFLDWIT